MITYRKSKRPLTLLRAYYLFLTGLEDKDILASGVSDKQLSQIRQFDSEISSGVPFISACIALNIDKTLGKRMWKMYYEKHEGKPISFCMERPRVSTVFKSYYSAYTKQHQSLSSSNFDERIYMN